MELNQIMQRTLILEQLEGRRLLSAAGGLADVGLLPACSVISVRLGHFASNSVAKQQIVEEISIPAGEHSRPPLDSDPVVLDHLPLSSGRGIHFTNTNGRGPEFNSSLDELLFGDDGAEGESDFDGADSTSKNLTDRVDIAIPGIDSVVGGSVGLSQFSMQFVGLSLRDAITPFGVYAQDRQATQISSNGQWLGHANGGFIQLELLERSDFDSILPSSNSVRSPYGELSSDDALLELLQLEGAELDHDSSDGYTAEGLAQTDDAESLPTEAGETNADADDVGVLETAAYDDAFVAEFGGLVGTISDAAACDLTRLSIRDERSSIVARSRDEYRAVDPIIGNLQAFEVIQVRFDEPLPVVEDDQVGQSDIDSDDNRESEAGLELTEASTVSASVLFFAVIHRRRKKQHDSDDPSFVGRIRKRLELPNSD